MSRTTVRLKSAHRTKLPLLTLDSDSEQLDIGCAYFLKLRGSGLRPIDLLTIKLLMENKIMDIDPYGVCNSVLHKGIHDIAIVTVSWAAAPTLARPLTHQPAEKHAAWAPRLQQHARPPPATLLTGVGRQPQQPQ